MLHRRATVLLVERVDVGRTVEPSCRTSGPSAGRLRGVGVAESPCHTMLVRCGLPVGVSLPTRRSDVLVSSTLAVVAVFTAPRRECTDGTDERGCKATKTVTGSTVRTTRDVGHQPLLSGCGRRPRLPRATGRPGNVQLGVTDRRDAVELHRRTRRIGCSSTDAVTSIDDRRAERQLDRRRASVRVTSPSERATRSRSSSRRLSGPRRALRRL